MSTVNGATIQNAGTPHFADVNGGNVAERTNIIISTLNQTGGTRNQNWRFLPVNGGTNLYTIQSLLTGQFVSVDSAASGQVIRTSRTSIPWRLDIVDTRSRNFTIGLPNTNLVWSVPASAPVLTNITLSGATANNTHQQWLIPTL